MAMRFTLRRASNAMSAVADSAALPVEPKESDQQDPALMVPIDPGFSRERWYRLRSEREGAFDGQA